MAVFQDVELVWGDRTYRISSTRMMRAISAIEDHVTLQELVRYGQAGAKPLAKLSCAFGAVLRLAGAPVSDDEVYARLFETGDAQLAMMQGIGQLSQMMLPPAARERAEQFEPQGGETATSGEALATATKAETRPASSRRPTSSRSRKRNG